MSLQLKRVLIPDDLIGNDLPVNIGAQINADFQIMILFKQCVQDILHRLIFGRINNFQIIFQVAVEVAQLPLFSDIFNFF